MKRADLTEKMLDTKREKGLDLETHLRADRRHVAGDDRRRRARPAEADQADGGRGRQAVRPVEGRGGDAQRSAVSAAPARRCRRPIRRTTAFTSSSWSTGRPGKALIQEEFGDGIMSAIDFDFTMERQADPKGDRVKIGMTRQVPAVQVLRRDGQRAGAGVQGGVNPLPSSRPRAKRASRDPSFKFAQIWTPGRASRVRRRACGRQRSGTLRGLAARVFSKSRTEPRLRVSGPLATAMSPSERMPTRRFSRVITGSRRHLDVPKMFSATSSSSWSSKQYSTSGLIISRTSVLGPLPAAMARMAMSRSVIMPTSDPCRRPEVRRSRTRP